MLPNSSNSSNQGKKEGVCSLLSLFTDKYAFCKRARLSYMASGQRSDTVVLVAWFCNIVFSSECIS